MNTLANLLMTGEAELVDRLMELLRILAGVVIMADCAHTGGYRAMQKIEFFKLLLLFFMTVKTELGLPLGYGIFRGCLERVAADT